MRAKRVKWTIRVLQNLGLERQTVQLVYFLSDFASSAESLRQMRLELLVVTSIYLVVKLQGDLPPALAGFNDFVSENLGVSRKELMRAELQLLAAVPLHFALLFTFSDFLVTCFPALLSRAPDLHRLVTRSAELCMGFYLFEGRQFDFSTLCAAGLMEAGSHGFADAGPPRDHFVAFFQSEGLVRPDQFDDIVESFLDENRYLKDIFPQI